MSTLLDKQITQKIMKEKKSKSGKTTFSRKQVGVLIAGISPSDPSKVIIGYSLCHKKDWYNHFRGVHVPDYDKKLAVTRALSWMEDEKVFVEVPDSLEKKMQAFISRCQKYYKDKELVLWATRQNFGNPSA